MTRSSVGGISYPAFAGAWAALLLSAPILASWSVTRPVAGMTYVMGSVICHQLTARSFHVGDLQLPVCARCLGLYAGAVIGALVSGWSRSGDASRDRVRRWRLAMTAATIPTVATLVVEWLTIAQPSNGIRFAAALPLGIAAAWLLADVVRGHLR